MSCLLFANSSFFLFCSVTESKLLLHLFSRWQPFLVDIVDEFGHEHGQHMVPDESMRNFSLLINNFDRGVNYSFTVSADISNAIRSEPVSLVVGTFWKWCL
jgi:hypothetical protein